MPTADNKLICLHPLALFPCTYIDSSRSIVETHKLLGSHAPEATASEDNTI